MVERLVANEEVGGSNPLFRSIFGLSFGNLNHFKILLGQTYVSNKNAIGVEFLDLCLFIDGFCKQSEQVGTPSG